MAGNRVSIVAMDLDGTLLGADSKVSEENREALKRCREKGIHVVLASGRSYGAIRKFALGMEIDCAIISCNGARMDASADGPTVLEEYIPREQAVRLSLGHVTS